MSRRFQFSLARLFWLLFAGASLSAIAMLWILHNDVRRMDKERENDPLKPGSQTYRVFYCFYGEDDELPSADAIPMDLADIYSKLLGRLTTDEDFLGMIDDEGHCLQMMYYAESDRYYVDIPAPEKHGSYGRYMDFDEIVDLMKALPTRFVPDAIPGLAFTGW